MLKRLCLCVLFIAFTRLVFAAGPVLVNADSISSIQKIRNDRDRKKALLFYIRNVFDYCPVKQLSAAQSQLNALLNRYGFSDQQGLLYFAESLSRFREMNLKAAESTLVKAIGEAEKDGNGYLLYASYLELGFIKTNEGDMINAVSAFRHAKQNAVKLNDPYLEIVIDINLSDLYYKNNFYNQAISYLNQAWELVGDHQVTAQRLKNIIYINKAENYFRMNNADSVSKYQQLLLKAPSGTSRLYSFRKRSSYYMQLLRHHYADAIAAIKLLKNDKRFLYETNDDRNLAEAYFNAGRTDSAKVIVRALLSDSLLNNHPEIKMNLYGLLGRIAEIEKNGIEATNSYKQAFEQSADQINRLTGVYAVASQIKTDEIESDYIKQVEGYKRQQQLMLFAIIVSILAIIIGTMLYRNIRQKRRFERLLYSTKQQELAFINSHEIRRHLSNILGIIDVIKHSDDRHAEFKQAEDHLLCAAQSLDDAIRNISAKLDS